MARSNDAAARMLQEFADLLAISDGDPFRVRSYEKAARSVAGYHAEIAGLDEKGLNAIPNVGSHIARKIVEFRKTASVEELDELRSRVPAGLRTLLAVPGLGPKRAHQVYDEIFKAAARTGTALEINSFPDRLDLDDELVRRARYAGVRFAIDTDAHAVPHLDYLRYGIGTAQRGWAGKADVINTYPLAKLRRFLGGRQRASLSVSR